jgi:hypothetical protein
MTICSSFIDLTLGFNHLYLNALFLFLLVSQLIHLPCPYSLVYVFRLWVVILYVSVVSVICLTAIEARFSVCPRKCWNKHSVLLECDVLSSRQQGRTFRRIWRFGNAVMFLYMRYDGSLLIISISCHPELCANNSTELCRVWETNSRSAGKESPSFLFS